MKTSAKKRGPFYLKLSVSMLLTVYVFSKVGWEGFITTVRNTDPLFILLNLVISPLLIFVSIVKWQLLLRAKAITVPLPSLFGLYLLGYFFNNLLPSNVGGDVIRGYKLGKETGKMEEVLAAVFMERMTGFTSLLVFVLVALGLNLGFLGDPKVTAALGVAVLSYLGVLWMALDPHPLAFCIRKLKFRPLTKVALKLQKLQEAIRSYRSSSGVWLPVIVLSVAFYLLAIVNVYLGCLAFNTWVSLPALAIAVPIILIISMVPISLGGIGLQEWGYFVVFGHLGIPAP